MKDKKLRVKLSITIPIMTCGPLLVFGIIAILVLSASFSSAMHEKVEGELTEIASSVLLTYDLLHEGDYMLEKNGNVASFVKGDYELTGDFSIIDKFAETTDSEISIFYKDTRMITTLKDKSGTRLVGSGANPIVIKDVVDNKTSKFYNKVNIEDKEYFAYYRPIITSQGACVGMIAIAKDSKDVNALVTKSTAPITTMMVVIMCLAFLASYIYSSRLGKAISKLQKSLAKIAKGELQSEVDYGIKKRNDEIADIADSISIMQNSLHTLVEKDALTNLYNRRLAIKKLEKDIKEAKKSGTKFCVALGDIDFFKKVNDTYGHDVGDDVLKEVARVMRKGIAGNGFVARWGGEEFLLVFEDRDLDKSYDILCSILDEVRELKVDDVKKITMSFGLVPGDEEMTVNRVVKLADDNLYFGKENGRNQIVCNKILEEVTEV